MNLALPAPIVEEAVAPNVEAAEPAIATMARPSHSLLNIQPPPIVEPATTDYDTTTLPTSKLQQQQKFPPRSVEGLRNAAGVNHLEGYAAILPRAPAQTMLQLLLPCLYGDRSFATYGEVKKYFFIKDTDCFVYNDMTDPMPLYKISLSPPDNSQQMYAMIEDRNRPDRYSTTISPAPNTNLPRDEMITVLLKARINHRVIYQFTFDTSSSSPSSSNEAELIPQRFVSVIENITKQ